MLPLAPSLASRPHASPAGTVVIVAVYGIGSLICHQLPERSFRLWTAQMPVCARCAGIYFGAAIAAIALAAAPLNRRPRYERSEAAPGAPLKRRPTYEKSEAAPGAPPRPRPTCEVLAVVRHRVSGAPRRCPAYEALAVVGHRFSGANTSRATIIIAALPTLLTLVYEWTTGHRPPNGVRFAAGVPIGVAVAWLVRAAAENQVN
jgi:uncharacterized membrane protein